MLTLKAYEGICKDAMDKYPNDEVRREAYTEGLTEERSKRLISENNMHIEFQLLLNKRRFASHDIDLLRRRIKALEEALETTLSRLKPINDEYFANICRDIARSL